MLENQSDHADVKVEPIVLVVIHILAVILLRSLLPLPFAFPNILEWLGYALLVFGVALAWNARNRFVQAHTTRHPSGSVTSVVTNGPYRFSRNPIYLGFLCLLAGLSLAFRTYWGLILSPLFIVLVNTLVIRHEEAYLEQKFKDLYINYKSRVRRWL
jgi:protein-S-isoprenylcysteine O-methyltransferase Ste14